MTKEDVNKEIDKVQHAVTRNRIRSIFEQCKTVDEFLDLTDDQALAKYRLTKQGKTAKYDLSDVTYVALSAVKANVKQKMYEERKAERDALKAEMWFTRDDITLTAAFMDAYKIAKIEMKQLRQLLNTLQRENESASLNPKQIA